ncbi:MAG: HAD family hydrolase [Comamonas sp. SCN 65-56]|uniref:HAD family hydrolase n=1 Tax=Comamonas sp. SCN 65-56 TaxID=1660095 RepID=UPI000868EF78|nr:HAD-IA family hydrolase [Comamonas sp. SCN 65-56]ODS91222.1 MAG: HAD family hydrolase [Comamonas sp. SCN 65-56]
MTLDVQRIRAISLDLDDTLWPVWPVIERAEGELRLWLARHAPATARRFPDGAALRALVKQLWSERPELRVDLGALRRESIRLALQQTGDDPALAEPAYACFYAARQKVQLFEDALAALEFLASRYPIVALTNGNADVHAAGVGRFFHAHLGAAQLGFAKPDARIFRAAAAVAGVAADAVLHVGDDAVLDMRGALDAGMQAAWVNRAGGAWPADQALRPQATVTDLTALCTLLR